MITRFNRPTLRELGAKILKAVEPVAQEMGVGCRMGGISFTATEATFKLTMAVKSEGGVLETQEASAFRVFAPSNGISADALGKAFTYRLDRYTIVGFNPRAAKSPILADRDRDGRHFKFTCDMVRRSLPADYVLKRGTEDVREGGNG